MPVADFASFVITLSYGCGSDEGVRTPGRLGSPTATGGGGASVGAGGSCAKTAAAAKTENRTVLALRNIIFSTQPGSGFRITLILGGKIQGPREERRGWRKGEAADQSRTLP